MLTKCKKNNKYSKNSNILKQKLFHICIFFILNILKL